MRVGLDWRPSHRARHRLLAALAPGSALSVALATVGALLAPGAAHAQSAGQPTLNQITHESGSPIEDQGSNYDYRSNITSVTPNVPGLSLEVLEFADRLVLTNHTGKTVTVYGYEGEPYARVQADGTVEVNTHSPAYYLNQSFYGQVTVPAFASSEATPHWVVADRTDSFEWHDHRIHWMSPIPPARVNGTGRRTLIFDWQVPIRVGAQMGHIDGQLFWAPERLQGAHGRDRARGGDRSARPGARAVCAPPPRASIRAPGHRRGRRGRRSRRRRTAGAGAGSVVRA